MNPFGVLTVAGDTVWLCTAGIGKVGWPRDGKRVAPVDGTAWEGLGGVDLLDEVCYEVGFKLQKTPAIPLFLLCLLLAKSRCDLPAAASVSCCHSFTLPT